MEIIGPAFEWFVSIPFLIFEKGDKQKVGQGSLRFVSIPFLNIWKKYQQKIGPGF